MKKSLILPLMILTGGFWGCQKYLTRAEFHPEVGAFVFFPDDAASWKQGLILRTENKKKIRDDSTSSAVLSKINRNPFLIGKYKFDLFWNDVSEGAKFQSGKLYYQGLHYLAEQKDSLARVKLEEALRINPHLTYFSDVNFLLGQTLYNQHKIDEGKLAFKNFLEYSESIHYPGFYQGFDTPEDTEELFFRAQTRYLSPGGDAPIYNLLGHNSNEIVKVKRRPHFPGYTLGKFPSEWKITGSGGYSNNRVYGVVGLRFPLTNRLDFFTSWAFGKKFNWYYVAFPYNIYLSDNNRLSIAVVTHYSFSRFDDINLLKRLIGGNLSMTYLWTPDFAIYGTFYIPYNSKEADNKEYFTSSYNQTYTQMGTVYYLYNRRPFSFGVFSEVVRGEIRFGIDLFGKIGYNLKRKELFIDVYNVFF